MLDTTVTSLEEGHETVRHSDGSTARVGANNVPRHHTNGERRRRRGKTVTAEHLADVTPDAAAYIFSPTFLWSVAADAHRSLLKDLGVTPLLPPSTTIGEMYTAIYSEMVRSYRSEYMYKNEVIRRIFQARHNPDRSTVLLEKPIAAWSSRVDLIVINETITAYEIKTDHDSLSRLRKQTDCSLTTFDRVYVVCSERFASSVESQVDARVGVLVMQSGGRITRTRVATDNAAYVNPATIFTILRREEYLHVLERRNSSLRNLEPTARYATCAELFTKLAPSESHTVLLKALQNRFIRAGDKDALQVLPYGMAHLYYKANAKERNTLFQESLLRTRID